MNRLKEVRMKLGLSQEEVARRARVSGRTIAAWETEEAAPRQRNARAVARALKVPVEDLGFRNGHTKSG